MSTGVLVSTRSTGHSPSGAAASAHSGHDARVDSTLASRYHERFADHAVSIAKKVQYLATGDWVAPEA